MRWGRSDSCLSPPTTRRHPAKPTRKSTGERACHQMPGFARCPVCFFPPTPSLSPQRNTHPHSQGRRRKELARSCRCAGDGPAHAFPPRRRAVTQPSQLESPPARGHATKCPVSPGAPCLLFLRSSPIESAFFSLACFLSPAPSLGPQRATQSRRRRRPHGQHSATATESREVLRFGTL
jgi:hypothetical protein